MKVMKDENVIYAKEWKILYICTRTVGHRRGTKETFSDKVLTSQGV